MAKSTTTRPRLAPMSTFTRVLRWVDSRSSSSSTPGAGNAGGLGRRCAGEPVRIRRTARSGAPTPVAGELPSGLRLGPARAAILHAVATNGFLDGPHRQALGHRPLGQVLLEGPVGRPEQGPGVAGRDVAVGQGPLDPGRELEKPEGIGHVVRLLPTRAATCSWV